MTQLMGLVYGYLMARYKNLKLIYCSGVAICLLAKGLHYHYIDPAIQIAGLVASQLILGLGFGVGVHSITICHAILLPKGQYSRFDGTNCYFVRC